MLIVLKSKRLIKEKYNCKILSIDEEYVTIKIGNTHIIGFYNSGCNKTGDKALVDILLYDDLEICQDDNN